MGEFILWAVGMTGAVFAVAFIFQLLATGLSVLRNWMTGKMR